MEEQTFVIQYANVDLDRAERNVLKDVNLTVSRGEFCYLTGRVGSGKSTLIKSMYADVPVSHGDAAEVLGYDVMNIKRKEIPFLRRAIGIVFQDFQLLQDRSARENLRFVLGATGWKNKGDIEARIDEVLNDVGMYNKGYKMPHELSGGEQQRIVIARALLNNPKLILADEPTGNLDIETGRNIMSVLHSLSAKGHAIIMATHNTQWVNEFPARVITCDNGRLMG